MNESTQAGRTAILQASGAILLEGGLPALTLDAVARRAGCAKGLVNYHFGTKDNLSAEVIRDFYERRIERWERAFDARTAQRAIDRTWQLIVKERDNGTQRLVASLPALSGDAERRAAREFGGRFAEFLASAAVALLDRSGLHPQIPASQLGWFLASVIQGTGLQLLTVENEETLREAYAAAWLGLIKLCDVETT
jgi:AcrR family transcriptional regulator